MDLRKNLIERRMVELDPNLAAHYLKYNVYETQRAIRYKHVDNLADKMAKGLFRFGEIAFAVRPNGQGDLMVNGQHVCSAVMQSGTTVPCLIEKFKVNSDLELSELFRQFEILPRSITDMVKVEAHSLKLDWPLRISNLVVAAASMEIAGGARIAPASTSPSTRYGKVLTKDEKVGLLKTNLKEGAFVNSILDDYSHYKFMYRASVVLMMFKTFRINKEVARIFWIAVKDGANLEKDSPLMKLRNFLMTISLYTQSRKQSTSNHEICCRCAYAWNAYRSGKKTNLTYYSDKPVPQLKN